MQKVIFSALANLCIKHSRKVLIGVLLFTILMILSIFNLKLEINQLGLLPKDSVIAKEYQHILSSFDGSVDKVTVLITSENTEFLTIVADELNSEISKLKKGKGVFDIQWKIPREYISNHGFMLIEDDELEKLVSQTKNLNLLPFLSAYTDNLEQSFIAGENKAGNEKEIIASLERTDKLLKGIYGSLQDDVDENALVKDWQDFWIGSEYRVSANQKHLMMTVQTDESMIVKSESAIKTIKKVKNIVEKVNAKYRDDGVHVALSGAAVAAYDELDMSSKDYFIALLVVFVLIFISLFYSFKNWVSPLLVLAVLSVGIIWTGGFVALFIGHLNLISMLFVICILGLGVDFCIHIMHGYNEHKAMGDEPEKAIYKTLIINGGSVLISGFAIACAFAVLFLTNFDALQELGIIVGAGIIIVIVASFLILPTCLYLYDLRLKQKNKYKIPSISISSSNLIGLWIGLIIRFRWMVLVLMIGLIVFSATNIKKIEFNGNIFDSSSIGLESIALQDTIARAFDQSLEPISFTVPSLDSAWAIYKKYENDSMVSNVESPTSFCPLLSEQVKRRPYLIKMQNNLSRRIRIRTVNLNTFKLELERLESAIIEISQNAYMNQQDSIVNRAASITGLDANGKEVAIGSFSPIFKMRDSLRSRKFRKRVLSFQKIFKKTSETLLMSMSNPEEITWDMLPKDLQKRYQSNNGESFIMTIVPRYSQWDQLLNSPFLEKMEKEIPNGMGLHQTLRYTYLGIIKGSERVFLFALLIVTLALLIYFYKNPLFVILAMLPTLSVLIVLIGMYAVLGIKLNIMSIIAIPIIFGLGINGGIHLCYRFSLNKDIPLKQNMSRVGYSVFLGTIITIPFVGTLIFGSMRGVVSLGWLLSLGILSCYLINLTVLPLIFSFMTIRKRKK